jgi:hypothetical protein
LIAPGISFNPPKGSCVSGFCSLACDNADSLPVVLEGDEDPDGGYLEIGIVTEDGGTTFFDTVFSSPDTYQTQCPVCQLPDGGTLGRPVPLRISHAWLSGSDKAIDIGPGADVTLGPLPVHIGSWNGRTHQVGTDGIDCGGAVDQPAHLRDEGSQTLQIDSQGGVDLGVEPYCSAVLTHSPRFGLQSDGGWNRCSERDFIGVYVEGDAILGGQDEPALIECQFHSGIMMPYFNPSAVFTGEIRNIGCFGVLADVGQLALYQSRIDHSHTGIWIGGPALVDLSGATVMPAGAWNDLTCSDREYQPAACYDDTVGAGSFSPGGAVVNATATTTANLQNVAWPVWDADAGAPQIWTCTDDSWAECTCTGPQCPDSGPQVIPSTAGLVTITANTSPFILDGGAQSGNPCP